LLGSTSIEGSCLASLSREDPGTMDKELDIVGITYFKTSVRDREESLRGRNRNPNIFYDNMPTLAQHPRYLLPEISRSSRYPYARHDSAPIR
jgi:hypothetical protein